MIFRGKIRTSKPITDYELTGQHRTDRQSIPHITNRRKAPQASHVGKDYETSWKFFEGKCISGWIARDKEKEMKNTSVFINVGRGPIVVEQDLADALNTGEIAAAGLDVLCEEPMQADNPLRMIKDSEKLIITPHIAWASIEARTRLMKSIAGQIRNFFDIM